MNKLDALKAVSYEGIDGTDQVRVSLICDGSQKTKDKIKAVVDHLKLPEETIEVVISYHIVKNIPGDKNVDNLI